MIFRFRINSSILFKTSIITVFILLFITHIGAFAAVTCSEPKVKCIESGGTRYFDNVPVVLDCWKYSLTHDCKEESDNNCKELREQGCSQITAKCKTMLNSSCLVQNELYRCPVEKCNAVKKVNCAKNLFCINGECASTNPTKSNSFDKAASSLAAVIEVAKEVEKHNTGEPIVFAGKPMECSKNIAGSKNCCGSSAEGWAEGVLSNCDAEEKELASAKGTGRTIYLGEYCHNEHLGVCTSHHKVYCVFDSKIARIVQNDGRKNQLGIDFGGVKNPNCRGISVEELSHLDFSKMNFSDFYSEIGKKDFKKIYSNIKSEITIPEDDEIKQKTTAISPDEIAKKSIKGVSEPNEDILYSKVTERIKGFYSARTK